MKTNVRDTSIQQFRMHWDYNDPSIKQSLSIKIFTLFEDCGEACISLIKDITGLEKSTIAARINGLKEGKIKGYLLIPTEKRKYKGVLVQWYKAVRL